MPKDYTQISSTNLTVQVICEHLYFLINDYPHFFIRLVDEWIAFETENEQAKRLEDAVYGITYPSRSRMQRELHPRIRFDRMMKKALSDARMAFEGLSIDERKWYLYTEAGQRKANGLCEVRHKEVESEDDSGGKSMPVTMLTYRRDVFARSVSITTACPETTHTYIEPHLTFQTFHCWEQR